MSANRFRRRRSHKKHKKAKKAGFQWKTTKHNLIDIFALANQKVALEAKRLRRMKRRRHQ